jgi:hypothetical protein
MVSFIPRLSVHPMALLQQDFYSGFPAMVYLGLGISFVKFPHILGCFYGTLAAPIILDETLLCRMLPAVHKPYVNLIISILSRIMFYFVIGPFSLRIFKSIIPN